MNVLSNFGATNTSTASCAIQTSNRRRALSTEVVCIHASKTFEGKINVSPMSEGKPLSMISSCSPPFSSSHTKADALSLQRCTLDHFDVDYFSEARIMCYLNHVRTVLLLICLFIPFVCIEIERFIG